MEPTGKSEKSEPQMGFEPTTFGNPFGCLTTEQLETGEMRVFDLSCIAQLQLTLTDSIAHNCITQSPLSISGMQPTNQPPNEQV